MDDNHIVIMEKPEYITYQDISAILKKAHEQHRKNGINMRVPSLPPEELEKWVGDEGKCFVAMQGDKLVGTGSIIIRNLSRWYHKGKAVEQTMLGVLPEYQGMHISTMIDKAHEEATDNSGYKVIYLDTAEENTRKILIAKKEGYILVDYLFPNSQSKGHYFVGMMKWLDGCPFSKEYCDFRFKVKKAFVRSTYALFGRNFYKIRKLIKH